MTAKTFGILLIGTIILVGIWRLVVSLSNRPAQELPRTPTTTVVLKEAAAWPTQTVDSTIRYFRLFPDGIFVERKEGQETSVSPLLDVPEEVRWSPDGNRALLARPRTFQPNDQNTIFNPTAWAMLRINQEPTLQPIDGHISGPVWSEDGTEISYLYHDQSIGLFRLAVADPDFKTFTVIKDNFTGIQRVVGLTKQVILLIRYQGDEPHLIEIDRAHGAQTDLGLGDQLVRMGHEQIATLFFREDGTEIRILKDGQLARSFVIPGVVHDLQWLKDEPELLVATELSNQIQLLRTDGNQTTDLQTIALPRAIEESLRAVIAPIRQDGRAIVTVADQLLRISW